MDYTHGLTRLVFSLPSAPPPSDDSIQVFIRVRPPDPNLKTDLDSAQILDVSPPDTIIFNSKEPKAFTYDRVAGITSTQVIVYPLYVYYVRLVLVIVNSSSGRVRKRTSFLSGARSGCDFDRRSRILIVNLYHYVRTYTHLYIRTYMSTIIIYYSSFIL